VSLIHILEVAIGVVLAQAISIIIEIGYRMLIGDED